MGNVLDQVLRYKQQREAEQAMQDMAVPNAINQFAQARQTSFDNLVKGLTTQATLAKQGLIYDQATNSLKQDSSLMSEEDLIDTQLKKAQLGYYKTFLGGVADPATAPPGTTVNVKGITVPVNPKLTESEQGVIAGAQSLDPVVQEITDIIKGGEFSSKGGDIGRTMEQAAVDTGVPLFVSKSEGLSNLQSKVSALKKTLPFTEGGKQLTGTEKKQVFALLNFTGKSDERIISDLNMAMDILRKKEKLALGGAIAAKKEQTQSTSTTQQIPDGTEGVAKDGTQVIRKNGAWVAK